jgi:ribonuclease HI
LKIEVYTDGATSSNGYANAVGGWAYVVLRDGEKIHEKSEKLQPATNNQCELRAIIEACKWVENYTSTLFDSPEIIIYSDSAYCINCYKQNWYIGWEANGWLNSKKQPVLNKEYWQELLPYFKTKTYKFERVKGHQNKDNWNDYVDRLAVEAKKIGNLYN